MKGKQAILRYLETHRTFTAKDVATECGMTINCITKNAIDLERARKIVRVSKVWRMVTYRMATPEEQAGTAQLHQRNISGMPQQRGNEASIDGLGEGRGMSNIFEINTTEESDFWSTKNFENTLSSILIAAFETKIRNQKHKSAWARLDASILNEVSGIGPYIPSNSRFFDADAISGGYVVGDIKSISHPMISAMTPGRLDNELKGYAHVTYCRPVNALPKGFVRRGGGQLFRMDFIAYDNDVESETSFLSVNSSGEIKCCDYLVHDQKYGSAGVKTNILSLAQNCPSHIQDAESLFGAVAEMTIDRHHSWCITAEEHGAKVNLGCMLEEVKSLFYARSLPVTETGRKRPIIHLVEAHKRRIKSGIDIDVKSHLRGISQIEMGGTLFTINQPVSGA